MKTLLITTKGELQTLEIDVNNFKKLYEILDYKMIETHRRQISGKYFTIFCDEEGALKSNQVVTAVNKKMEPQLVGNLLITQENQLGNDYIGLSKEDIKHITSNGIKIAMDNHNNIRNMLICEL